MEIITKVMKSTLKICVLLKMILTNCCMIRADHFSGGPPFPL